MKPLSNSFTGTILTAVAFVVTVVVPGHATDRTFVPSGSGAFLTGTNWNPAFTSAWDPSDRAIITNGATVNITTGTTTLTEAYAGNAGATSGAFTQTGGSLILNDGLVVGRQGTATGTYTLTGGSLTTRDLRLGGGSTTAVGTMTVSGSGVTMTSGTGSATTALIDGIGVNGTGTFTLSNSAIWSHSATPLVVGGDNQAAGAASNTVTGGTGTLNVQSGASLNLNGMNLSVGRNPSGNGTVNVDGGTISTGTGAINLGPLNGGTAGGTGVLTVNQSSSTPTNVTATSINVNEGTGTINFNGGTVTTGAIARLNGSGVASPGTATVNFNGASIVASANSTAFHSGFGTTGSSLNILSGGYLLNTGNFAVTVAAPLVGSGPFIKTGAGTLAFGGANTYAGTTTVGAGGLIINGNQSGATGNVVVSSGSTLGGVGTIGGATTIANGATITGATTGTVGTLSFSSGVTINGQYTADVTNGVSDQLAIGGALTIGSGSSITVHVTSSVPTAAKYVLATYSSLSNGTSVRFSQENLPSGYSLNYTATELDLVGTPGVATVKPNVIVMLVDDLGWSDLGSYGGEISTPNIDALAASGIRFRQFYNGARCAPSRAAVLTGLYPQQGAVDPSQELPNLRNDNNVTIAELLHSNGYHTYMAGKWNLGVGPLLPEARGFEHCWRFLDGNSHSEDQWNLSRYTQASPSSATSDPAIPTVNYTGSNPFYQTNAVGDYSVEFIDHDIAQNDGEPFFIYMAFGAPHFPLGAPGSIADTYMNTYSQGWDVVRQNRYNNMLAQGIIDSRYPYPPLGGTPPENDTGEPIENLPAWASIDSGRQADLTRRMALYAAMVQEVDANVAKVVNHLKDIGQLDNTLILFLSDNGANYEYGKFGTWTGSTTGPALTGSALTNMGQDDTNDGIKYGGGWAHVSNTPLRLFKHFAHEGGIRTPMIAHWPAGFTGTGGWTEEVGHIIDILPTIADAAGAPYPSTYNNHAVLPVQGVSVLPALKGGKLAARNLEVEHETNRMIRQGKWKLVTKDYTLSDYSSYANQLELYDMSVDPGESNNLSLANPALVIQLIDQWNAWANYVGVPVVRDLEHQPVSVTPGQSDTDLFVDTFNRSYNVDIDTVTTGMYGSLLPSMAANAIWFEGYEGSGRLDSIFNMDWQVLNMAFGPGMSENGLNHNFVDPSITNAGGFSVSLRTIEINSDGTDPSNRYIGFGVGLNATQAAAGNDINITTPPQTIRGNTGNPGCADCFVEVDENNNVKVWIHGVLQATVPVGTTVGTLTAAFNLSSASSSSSVSKTVKTRNAKKTNVTATGGTSGFNAGDTVTLSVYFNDQRLNLSSSSTNGTLSFTWDEANANYIALSARAVNYAQMDNFAVRLLPLANTAAIDYAMSKGLDGANASPTADPDGDGLDNFGEWAFGTDPTKADGFLANTTMSPGNVPNQGFIFAHRRLVDYQNLGVVYRYAVSPDLVNWHYTTPTQVSTAILPNSPGYEAVQLRLSDTETAGQSRLFVRVEVPH